MANELAKNGQISFDIRQHAWYTKATMINTDSVEISHELLSFVAEIDKFQGAWQAHKSLAPERLDHLLRVATIESIGSSTRIEGSQMTDLEVEVFLGNLKVNKFETRDQQEVAGYAHVMNTVHHSWKYIEITENHIKQLHGDLLKFCDKDVRHRGEYKKNRNDVVAFDSEGRVQGVVFETATPFETPKRMRELVEWYSKTKLDHSFHPLFAIAIFKVVFLAIHPFQDGNGRLSRILTILMMLQAGYEYVPYASFESVIEANKRDYYKSLRETQATLKDPRPNWRPWLMYFFATLQRQKTKLIDKVEFEQKSLLEGLSPLASSTIDFAKVHGKVQTIDLVREYGAARSSIKYTFNTLIRKGLLEKHSAGRTTWYKLTASQIGS